MAAGAEAPGPGGLNLPAAFHADCQRCAALCCVAPAFDAVQGFGFDKAAHQACPHLQADHRCGIHARLREQGFAGCTAYDCHGAGPWVTALFGGVEAPASAARLEAFMRLRPLHELLMLLTLAQARAGAHAEAVAALRLELDALREAEEAGQAVFRAEPWRARVHALLRQLAA